jgi:glycosyltransferase involved in cell wall biosynthesis
MARVALLVPCYIEADAVSNDVRGMHKVLTGRGHEARVFAAHRDVGLPSEPPTAARRFLRSAADVLIYHHSTGWAEGGALLAAVRCRRAVKYHNVTPPEFFEGIDQDYVLACRAGRRQLAALARAGCDRYLADSGYNLNELLSGGAAAPASAVVPPFHNIDRLLSVAPDHAVLERCRDGKTNVLVVGRLAPNKGHGALFEAFARYHRRHNPASRLIVVGKGDERLAVYTEALRARAARLGLGDAVVFTGGVSEAALRAYYETAAVFAIASAHEGFCVPLVEAMALGVPVIALGSTAVPDTVGGAGLVWEEPDADLLAESIHAVVTDEPARCALARAGRRRYEQHYRNDAIARQLLGALDGLL